MRRAKLLNIMGVKHYKRVHFDNAESLFSKAIELEPKNPQYKANLAVLNIEKGKNDIAKSLMLEATEIAPKQKGFWEQLALIYDHLKDIEGIERAFTEYLKIDPLCALAWYHLGSSQHKYQKFHASETSLLKSAELDPTNVQTLNNLCVCQIKLGKYSDAEKNAFKALDLKPDCIIVLKNLASVQITQLKYDEAATSFMRLILLDPEDLSNWIALYKIKNIPKNEEFFKSLTEEMDCCKQSSNVAGLTLIQKIRVYQTSDVHYAGLHAEACYVLLKKYHEQTLSPEILCIYRKMLDAPSRMLNTPHANRDAVKHYYLTAFEQGKSDIDIYFDTRAVAAVPHCQFSEQSLQFYCLKTLIDKNIKVPADDVRYELIKTSVIDHMQNTKF